MRKKKILAYPMIIILLLSAACAQSATQPKRVSESPERSEVPSLPSLPTHPEVDFVPPDDVFPMTSLLLAIYTEVNLPTGLEYVGTIVCIKNPSVSIVYEGGIARVYSGKCRCHGGRVGDFAEIPSGTMLKISFQDEKTWLNQLWVYVGEDPDTGLEGLWIPKSQEGLICRPGPSKPPLAPSPPTNTDPPGEA
jgi:hypothetical protein